jgi:hypothetical protein
MDAGDRWWKRPVEGRSLSAEDQLFILMQAGHYLTATRGLAASEARICYERAESGLHPWPRNALRHSFISYALTIDHDENRIALESGNTPEVIHTNYRALVTREEAERFWNIRPLVNTPTNGTKNFGMSKPTKSGATM